MDETWKCYGKELHIVPPGQMMVEHVIIKGLASNGLYTTIEKETLWLKPIRCLDGKWLMLTYSCDREVVYARPASESETKRFDEQLLAGEEIR